jgi:hypothetical protein
MYKQIEEVIDIYAIRLVINSCFVAYILPSGVIFLAIHYTLYRLCQIKPKDGRTYATTKQLNFGFTTPS